MPFYINTKSINLIMSNNLFLFNYDDLNSCETKQSCMKYLYNVYRCRNVGLSNIDYHNLYDIAYILCLEDFSLSNIEYRSSKAIQFVNQIKNSPNRTIPQLDINFNEIS